MKHHVKPYELVGEAEKVPGFKRVKYRKLCYHCKHAEARLGEGFWCKKHDLYFGAGENAIVNMAEFCCDDFAAC